MKNPRLWQFCKFVVFMSYIVAMIGLPIYLSLPLLDGIWRERTIIGGFGLVGYMIVMVLWILFMMAIFGYAVSEDDY